MASTSNSSSEIGARSYDCSVCLQPCTHPVKLPTCSHIFCFLCVKGAASRSNRCPICRTTISPEFFQKPHLSLLDKDCLKKSTNPLVPTTAEKPKNYSPTNNEEAKSTEAEPSEAKSEWFYEARAGGWWRYEKRQENEIEKNFNEGTKKLELLIAGHIYVIDLDEMVQHRKDQPQHRRRIKRDQSDAILLRGIAGLSLD